MLPEVVALSENHALAVWRNVVIQIWEGPLEPDVSVRELQTTLATFKRMRRALQDRQLLAFSVISERTTLPGPRSRAIAAEFPSYFDYYVGVHEGPEHRGSIVRTAIGAMALQARVTPRFELVGDVLEGSRALAMRSGGALLAEELYDAVFGLRARIATEGAA